MRISNFSFFFLLVFLIGIVSSIPVGYGGTEQYVFSSDVNTSIYIINDSEVLHNDLTDLQGGVAGEYYHIRQTWYDELASDIFNWITQAEGDARYSLIGEPLWTSNLTAYNSSWNNVTNNSYYLVSNPYSFYNSTTLPGGTEDLWTSNWTTYNSTWSNVTNNSYYLVTNPFSFYNSTNTIPIINSSYYLSSNPFSFYNSTNPSPVINTSYYLETNPFSFYNSTDFSIGDYYLKNNPFGYYNESDGNFTSSISWTNVMNGTLYTQAEFDANYTANNDLWLNTTNLSYVPYTGASSNVDLGIYNLTTKGTGFFANIVASLNGSFGDSLLVSQDFFVLDDSFFSGDIFPSTTLSSDIGSGAYRWAELFIQNISSDYINNLYDISTANLEATGNITASGYFLLKSLSNLNSRKDQSR